MYYYDTCYYKYIPVITMDINLCIYNNICKMYNSEQSEAILGFN